MITELANGNEWVSETGELMGLSCTERKAGMHKFTRVCGLKALSVGQGNEESVVSDNFVDARAVDSEEMAGASGIGYCFGRGWGTARR